MVEGNGDMPSCWINVFRNPNPKSAYKHTLSRKDRLAATVKVLHYLFYMVNVSVMLDSTYST